MYIIAIVSDIIVVFWGKGHCVHYLHMNIQHHLYIQGVAKKVSPKTENFKIEFYTLILCSYLCKITKLYLIITNFDKLMPY